MQEALLKALRLWSYAAFPKSRRMVEQVARNQALDVLRRSNRWREKEEESYANSNSSDSLVASQFSRTKK